MTATSDIVPDSERRGLIGALPPRLRPFASLIRLDRPIGSWLLYWPAAWGVALAGVHGRWDLFLWLALGAFAMRSAGCVYNDIVDRELDQKVERTRLRPLASDRVSLAAAWALTILLCGIGLVVLLQFNRIAQGIALASIALVAAYPFMKRVTWWPQAWLGLVFAWGALVGWPAVMGSSRCTGAVALRGQRRLGDRLRHAVRDPGPRGRRAGRGQVERPATRRAGPGWYRHLLRAGADPVGRGDLVGAARLAGAVRVAARRPPLANQALRADPGDGEGALRLFRSNRTCGLLVFLGHAGGRALHPARRISPCSVSNLPGPRRCLARRARDRGRRRCRRRDLCRRTVERRPGAAGRARAGQPLRRRGDRPAAVPRPARRRPSPRRISRTTRWRRWSSAAMAMAAEAPEDEYAGLAPAKPLHRGGSRRARRRRRAGPPTRGAPGPRRGRRAGRAGRPRSHQFERWLGASASASTLALATSRVLSAPIARPATAARPRAIAGEGAGDAARPCLAQRAPPRRPRRRRGRHRPAGRGPAPSRV